MLAVVMFCHVLRQRAFSVDAYFIALATVSIFDPPALLTASFWLSFFAVGWLLFITTTQPPTNKLHRLLQMHLYLALGLSPLLRALHQSVPLASPLANLVAVPIVTLAIMPLVLSRVLALAVNPSLTSTLWRAAASVGGFVSLLVNAYGINRAAHLT
jgi:competence protein ComEC